MSKVIALLSFVSLLANSLLDKSPDVGSATLRMFLALMLLVSLLFALRKEFPLFCK